MHARLGLAVFGLAALATLSPAHADAPAAPAAPLLTATTPVAVPGGPGKFDWMMIDAARHHLLASHPSHKTLVIYDLVKGDVKQIDTDGAINGEAVDEADNKLFVGGGNQKVVAFDLTTLDKLGEVALTGPADAILFNAKNGVLYADHDDGAEVWMIDPKTLKINGSVAIADAPEAIEYDPATDRLYQNIKPSNCVQVINPATNKVEATWPTAPMTSPHGIAIDSAGGRIFAAGQGKVDLMDIKTGKVLATVDIEPGYVDQIAFDSSRKRLYCASSAGVISVVDETADGATLAGKVTVPKGTHTLAVDQSTGDVWISYSDAAGSNLQKWSPAK
ncbi:hypothetical protein CCAX7_005570 [Capsulimonas corticalis]|uniref:Uncharacterized protein n=1 Tax=Capsulimonas corticalis TaxID=2219043 RepID=A0A402D348_9BACT|nr:YncE family protein [Capsulimonas corticalis]BDI28506.1 hypothetical protein CCAX7_005570 [Capsulimonas corticalis]